MRNTFLAGLTLALLSSPSVAADGDKPAFSLYGFVIPTWIVGTGAAESFSQPNLSAFTAAGNPALAVARDEARSSFQVAQSRFGFLLSPTPETVARLEFDLIDFSKASPTTAALPRVRRAVIEYKASDDLMLKFGQDWDIVSPLAPHSFNLVGHYFESGDIGFMRIQAQAILRKGDWEHAVALGLPGNNNAASDNLLELGVLPTIAVRESFYFEKGRVGVSAIATALKKAAGSSDRIFSGAVTAFLEAPIGPVEMRTEAYLGQNTFNIGLLGLGFGNATSSAVKEAGAYLTARLKLGESMAVFAGAGASWVLNPGDLLPSYALGASGRALSGTGPGIESNATTRVGMEWTPHKALTFFGEIAGLFTSHRLIAADSGIDGRRTAIVGQLGTMLSF